MIAIILMMTAVLFALLWFVAYLVDQSEKRWKNLVREVALAHGCNAPGTTEKNAMRSLNVYEWQDDGFRVILGGGSSMSGYGAVRVKATKGLVMVAYPMPLPLKLCIRQGKGQFTGDPEFDRRCGVETDNLLKAHQIMESPDLRAAICKMVHSMIHMARINNEMVYTMFYDRKEFREGVDETVKLAKQVYHRVSELGV